MAAKLGMSKSALARFESGESEVTASDLFDLLGIAGFFLVPIREDGQVMSPFDIDGARDFAGRRYPAHRQVFRTMRGDFADYWYSMSRDEFFALRATDDRELPLQGRRRPRPRVRRGYASRRVERRED
jgi:transcriptional regulator with XRE-family HTH domain